MGLEQEASKAPSLASISFLLKTIVVVARWMGSQQHAHCAIFGDWAGGVMEFLPCPMLVQELQGLEREEGTVIAEESHRLWLRRLRGGAAVVSHFSTAEASGRRLHRQALSSLEWRVAW